MEKGKCTNLKNSWKINENSYNDNFFEMVIRRKSKFIEAKKSFGVSGTSRTSRRSRYLFVRILTAHADKLQGKALKASPPPPPDPSD